VSEHSFEDIVDTMKRSIAAFREAEIPFLLAGSLAVWAQGGPEKRKDLDFVVKREDAERAVQALADIGMRPETPPEDWLLKAWDGDICVDVIFEPLDLPIDDEVLARGKSLNVMAMNIPAMALEDILYSKLLAINEHYTDYTSVIGLARAVREQVDWETVRARTEDKSPFAKAFFVIVEGLGILDPVSA